MYGVHLCQLHPIVSNCVQLLPSGILTFPVPSPRFVGGIVDGGSTCWFKPEFCRPIVPRSPAACWASEWGPWTKNIKLRKFVKLKKNTTKKSTNSSRKKNRYHEQKIPLRFLYICLFHNTFSGKREWEWTISSDSMSVCLHQSHPIRSPISSSVGSGFIWRLGLELESMKMEGFNNFSNERRRCVVCVTNVTVVSLNLILLRLRLLKLDAMSAIFSQYGEAKHTTVCPRSSDPFYITYYIKWVTSSWTYTD